MVPISHSSMVLNSSGLVQLLLGCDHEALHHHAFMHV